MGRATARYSTGVFGGLNRLIAVALVAGTVLLGPPVALACNGGSASAVNVYRECLPTGGGDKPTGTPTTTQKPTHVSSRTAQALKHAGKDKHRLLQLVQSYGQSKRLMGSSGSTPTSDTSPSALGSAFDLGSGPTALLLILVGTAVLLLGTSGLRGYRRRQRP